MTVAYFSMEIGLEPEIPTYAGGLGVLAGDALRSAADLRLPMVGVSLLQRQGYFRQALDGHGNQAESPDAWVPEDHLEALDQRVTVTIEGRPVGVRAWRYDLHGVSGSEVPVFLLDTALPENQPWDRTLTDVLYGGDDRYRLCQEVVLGIGGVAMLEALGFTDITAYHMNEGHSSLLALALLERQVGSGRLASSAREDHEAVRRRCVFTTHTPVPAGMDQFTWDLAQSVLGPDRCDALERCGCRIDSRLNMTHVALTFSRYINGVAMRHEQISRGMFPRYPVNSIDNGVHAVTWTSQPFRDLFDNHIPEWRRDNLQLRYAVGIPAYEVTRAHGDAKAALIGEVRSRAGVELRPEVMTIGFARRATAYKRPDLLFTDLDRLRRVAHEVGALQVVYAGKAHPRDEGGKAAIRQIFAAAEALAGAIPVVYLPGYDMKVARYVCSGVDLWLNTPLRPREASGTSGMKAALNGVPSLSVLDGWWIEGHLEGVTGWSIGESWEPEADPTKDAAALYDKLESTIMPMFYGRPTAYAQVMRSAVAVNGSFFNTERMMFQYARNAYGLTLP